ncbi:MAG: phosphoribosylamine--glycine ligase [Clostridiales bacterium]|jgi:phosphoribosylamine--glycine ligase|nr:phosphoribosylamine--glycine ligase [Clostridiales bacterium]
MKVLVVGSGGREHAIIWKLKRDNPEILLYCAPGNSGMREMAVIVPISANDMHGLAAFAKREHIDLTIVGTEEPLVRGIVNYFEKENLRIFGPTKKAALLEGSKAYAKGFMEKHHIPTASCAVFHDYENASAYARDHGAPLVVKADGLAAGKGVLVCETFEQADNALRRLLLDQQFAEAGEKVVVEDKLEGPEVSVLAFCDGKTLALMASAKDYKRALDGDKGANTGGMGAVSPAPGYTPEIEKACMREIFMPTLEALKGEGIVYKGIIYFGLMLTSSGPKVIEYNCRLGDPEAQAVLPRLRTNLLDVILAVVNGELDKISLEWDGRASACVVLASDGYPGSYIKGRSISGLQQTPERLLVFHAGTAEETGADGASCTVTNGGRVLDLVCLGEDAESAARAVYEAVPAISFQGMMYRKDIGNGAEALGEC